MTGIRDVAEGDFEAVFALLDARSRAAFGISEETREHLRQRWDLATTDTWVAVDGEAVVGYAALDEDRSFGLAAADPGVADALIAHLQHQARLRGFPEIAVVAVTQDVPLYEAVQRNGFALNREVLRMWRTLEKDPPAPVWPEDVTVRTFTESDGERVQALLDGEYGAWDANYVARSHEGWRSFMTEHGDFDPEMWFLAERAGDLVACALHWKESQGRGWVKDIAVRGSERGRGLAKALLQHGFREYAARGVRRVGLKVDSTNPTGAPELYERLGFVTDQHLAIWQKAL